MSNWEFHFRSFGGSKSWFGVYHAGCGGPSWHDGCPQCWYCYVTNNPTGGQHSVYCPADWVINFGAWFQVLVDSIEEAADIGMAIASGGEDVDAIADALEGAFDVARDVVKAEIKQHRLNTEDLSKALHENFNKACAAIGKTPEEVRDYANRMNLGDNWGFISAQAYRNKVYSDNSINGGHGWVVLYAYNGYSVSKAANHAFIQNGHLIYMWDPDNNDGFWTDY